MVVSLVYQQEPKELGEPPKQSVGIDPGVKHNITAVSDDETVLQLPGIDGKQYLKTKRRLLRKLRRQRDAAIKDERARFITQRTRPARTSGGFAGSNDLRRTTSRPWQSSDELSRSARTA